MKDDVIESLVVAVLSVNNYRLEKTWALLPRFRVARVTDPKFVVTQDLASLTVLLSSSGYDRGTLTGLFAERIKDLMTAIESGELDELTGALQSHDDKRTEEILCKVRGVGKRVAANAIILLLSEKK